MLELCRRSKKKRRDTAGHQNPTRRTCSGVRHVSNTDTTPKMACPCNLGWNPKHGTLPKSFGLKLNSYRHTSKSSQFLPYIFYLNCFGIISTTHFWLFHFVVKHPSLCQSNRVCWVMGGKVPIMTKTDVQAHKRCVK